MDPKLILTTNSLDLDFQLIHLYFDTVISREKSVCNGIQNSLVSFCTTKFYKLRIKELIPNWFTDSRRENNKERNENLKLKIDE